MILAVQIPGGERDKERKFKMKATLWFPAVVLALLAGPAGFAGDSSARLAYGLYQVESEACQRNMTALNAFLRAYARDHQGMLPEGNNFAGLRKLGVYGADFTHFVCRGNSFRKARSNQDLSEEKNPFFYFGGMNLEAAAKTSPNIPLLCDKPGGRHTNILFVDGRVETLAFNQFKRKISNCRDLIEQLHAQYHYSPEVLEMLRLKAGAIDNAR